jgi:hypothetical protein
MKAPPTAHTVEVLVNELADSVQRFQAALEKFRVTKPGTEPYRERLSDLEIELFDLQLKARHAHEAVDEFEGSLPDKDKVA